MAVGRKATPLPPLYKRHLVPCHKCVTSAARRMPDTAAAVPMGPGLGARIPERASWLPLSSMRAEAATRRVRTARCLWRPCAAASWDVVGCTRGEAFVQTFRDV